MRVFLLSLLTLLPLTATALEGSMLLYQVQEPDTAPYPSRILVSEAFVRMDDNADDGDYLLFDRKRRLISSVTHDDGTIFEIPVRPVEQKPPQALQRRSEVVSGKPLPKVAGEVPRHHQLYVNDTLCYNVVAVSGLLKEAQQALHEFRQILAGEHAKVLPRIPADMRDPCDMAMNIFHPNWQLEFGLPIHEWDTQGRRQMLLDYREHLTLDEKLFTLPKGYQHYTSD